MSLRTRLFVSIALVLLVSIAAGGALAYWHAVKKVETEIQAAIAVGARIAYNALDDGAAANPRRRLGLVVEDFNGDRHVRAVLIDGGGHVVTASTVLLPEDPAPAWFHRLLAGEPQTVRLQLPPPFEGQGSVVLETDAGNELAEAWSDVKLALSVLALFCVLVLALVHWTLGRALGSLKELTGAIGRVGDGDYGPRVGERGPRELVGLCRGFNRMAERLAAMQTQNRRLNDQLATVQEEERAELARDLHDGIGPFLFAVDVDIAAIQQLLGSGEHERVAPRVGAVREAVAHMRRQLRGVLGRLRSGMLPDLGLADATDSLVQFWQARHPATTFDVDVPEEGFGPALDAAIYRIVQESVSNALRHGRPSRIEVAVSADAAGRSVLIDVSDDGGGLQRAAGASGFGIVGMRERVAALDGTLLVADRPDRSGVLVSARIPLQRPAARDGRAVPMEALAG